MAALIRNRRPRNPERGAELIEFAFVLPLLLLVCIGIIDFGFLFRDYEIVTNAAREGARLRSLADSYALADVESRVDAYADSGGLDAALVDTEVNEVDIPVGAGTARGYEVIVTYPHEFLFLGPIASFFGGSFGTVNLSATSTMRSEVQAAP
jgi:Flp pilus assembly protein TadG